MIPNDKFIYGAKLTLEQFREVMKAYWEERITSPDERVSKTEIAHIQTFLDGGKLPLSPYFRDPTSYVLQYYRIANREELFDLTMAEWYG